MAACRSDPCGIICIIITYSAVFYADYVVIWHLVIPAMSNTLWGSLCVILFNLIVFLMTVSHMRAVLSDPGIVPLPKTGLDFSDLHAGRSMPNTRDGWSVCNKCETYRPPRAHHCRICRRCVRKMDHHCPWINNCVGEFNQKYFIQFLFYVGMASCYATTMVIVSWVLDPSVTSTYKHTKLIHSVILIIECILFGMFVIAIGCDQISSILSDETLVEQVKKEGIKREKKSTYKLLQEVFGKGHPLVWMCPLLAESHKDQSSKQYIV